MNYQEIILLDIRNIRRKFPLLSDSYSREVFCLDEDLVLKVPKRDFPAAKLQSKQEKYLYLSRSNYEDTFLCPILAESKDRIVMPKAILLRDLIEQEPSLFYYGDIKSDFLTVRNYLGIHFDNFLGVEDLENAIEHLVQNRDMSLGDLEKTRNWGIVDNKLMLFDYGLTSGLFNQYCELPPLKIKDF